MKNNLAALSMDLKRAALGLHRGNLPLAQKFITLSQKNIKKLKIDNKNYIYKIIKKIDLDSPDNMLMVSQILQNYIVSPS